MVDADPSAKQPVIQNAWTVALAILLPLLVLGALFVVPCTIARPGQLAVAPSGGVRGQEAAPSWPADMQWLNVRGPLRLEDLRGKVVLLSFWNCCCARCLEPPPDMKALLGRFCDELVIVGAVASPGRQGGTDQLRQTLAGSGIMHPVVQDPQGTLAKAYGVQSWPTHVVIDPSGKIVSMHQGTDAHRNLESVIAQVIRTFDAEGGITRRPVEMRPEKAR